MLRLSLLAALAACAPYDPYGVSERFQSDVEGHALLVQKDPRKLNAWAATIDPSRQVVSLGYDPLTRRRVSVTAIEQVSGCAVARDTVIVETNSRAVFAMVNCP